MVENTIRIAIGEKPDLSPKWNKGSAIRYFKTGTGIIKSIKGINEAKTISGVIDINVVHDVGEQIGDIKSSTDRVGFVIAQSEDAKQAIAVAEKAVRAIDIVVAEEMCV